jgi:hypothetical protein
VRWSELPSVDPVRLEIELANAGTDQISLVCDAYDVPKLEQILEGLSKEAALRVALEWFGDQGNPQPPREQRTESPWTGYTPDFGRLHRLDDAEPVESRQPRTRKPRDQTREPGEIPTDLVGQAVRHHAETSAGRRKIPIAVPGLGEWAAGQILKWYSVGKPAGLWLDEHDRLQWGAAITPIWDWEQGREQSGDAVSPTPDALRLPRL